MTGGGDEGVLGGTNAQLILITVGSYVTPNTNLWSKGNKETPLTNFHTQENSPIHDPIMKSEKF